MADISWIKLSVNIFDDEKIKLIRKMPEGDAMLLIWIQLLCLAGKTNDCGAVYIGQNMHYTDEMLATICDQPLNTVRLALQTFDKFEMIELEDDGLIVIENWEKHQNIEGMEKVRKQTRERVARFRERQKQLDSKNNQDSNVTVTLSNATDKIRIDKNKIRIDKIRKDNNISPEEDLVIKYYYGFLKNNTSKADYELIVKAIKECGWKKVLYTLIYLKEDQKANVSGFNYVNTTLSKMKYPNDEAIDFVVNRRIKELKS